MARVIFILLLFSLITSCEKRCTGNCADITITGQVLNASNNQGIAKVPIEVYWQESGFGFFNTSINVARTKTNKHGHFKISETVDKAMFEDYNLRVVTAMPPGFINNYGQNEGLTQSIRQYQRDIDLRMVVYPEAKLLIKLINNQNDSFNYFNLSYSYHEPYGAIVFQSNGGLKDTTFTVKTAADVYTKINWRKGYGFGQTTAFVDSILCSSSKDNIFVINY